MPMSNSQTVDRNRAHGSGSKIALADRGRDLPLHVSYPANDFAPPPSPPDIGLGMLLVYAGIAAVTVGIVFAGVLPWALRHEGSGGVALALAILGTLLAPGFWTGVPPGLAAGGARSAGVSATKGRRLSQAAFVIGVLGVLLNVNPTRKPYPLGTRCSPRRQHVPTLSIPHGEVPHGGASPVCCWGWQV